jgi:ABC-type uncharacterized transport system permease subunit
MVLSALFAAATLILYALAAVSAIAALPRKDRAGGWLTPVLSAVGLVAQSAQIVATGLEQHRCPVLDRREAVSLLAALVVLSYLIAFARTRLAALSAIFPPAALVILLTSNALELVLPPRAIALPGAGESTLFAVHVTIALAGIAALFLSCAFSALYLAQDRLLKSKTHGAWRRRLPPLDRCDQFASGALLFGFPLLTLAILSGSILNASRTGQFWSWRLDQAMAVVAWGILFVALWARLGGGWRGRRSAWLTLAGFAAGVLTLIGMFL